jgi:hypothetical protein
VDSSSSDDGWVATAVVQANAVWVATGTCVGSSAGRNWRH